MRTDDGCIVQECLNGDSGAFGILVDKYKAGIYAYIYDKLHNFQDAQDVTQEVFLQAYRSLRTLRRWESFGFWLFRIARNQCGKWIRTQSRRPDRAFIEDQNPKALEATSLDTYRDSQIDESLQEALDSLPETYHEVLMLHYFGGMTIKNIASAIGVSPNAVRVRLSRARARLREEMIAMMDTAFEEQRLQASFTFRIVEAVKRIRIHPMPRMAGLPWGLSAAVGIIITVLSLNPQMSITSDMANPVGSPLPVETKMLKTGEIPVDILKTSEISVISSKQANGDGGEPQLDPQNTLVLAPHAKGGMWMQKADMEVPRHQYNGCALDGKIYAIGGIAHGADSKGPGHSAVERYDPKTNKWTFAAEMPLPRFAHTADAVDGRIYVIGGGEERGDPHPDIFPPILVYDPAKDQWAEKGGTPFKFWNHGSAAVNEKIYLIGSMTIDQKSVSKVYEYDPKLDIWTRKSDMPTSRGCLGVAAVNGKIYAIGGVVSWDIGPIVSAVEEYDPVTDKWARKADMLSARFDVSAVASDGKLYAIGGISTRNAAGEWVLVFPPPEVYDPTKDEWTELVDMRVPRYMLSSSVVNGEIYAIGGMGEHGIDEQRTASLPTVEEYTPEGWRAIFPQDKLPTTWEEVKSE